MIDINFLINSIEYESKEIKQLFIKIINLIIQLINDKKGRNEIIKEAEELLKKSKSHETKNKVI